MLAATAYEHERNRKVAAYAPDSGAGKPEGKYAKGRHACRQVKRAQLP